MSLPALWEDALEVKWRTKLGEAELRYRENRSEENRAEFRRVLGIYAALVIRGEKPKEKRLVAGANC